MDNVEQQVMGTPKKRRRWEITAILLVVALAASIFGYRSYVAGKSAKEDALMMELRSLRTAVQLYVTVNKNVPGDLTVLATQKYTLGDRSGDYLTGIKLNKDNNPVDAFGNVFSYDKATGKVGSTTKGYENW